MRTYVTSRIKAALPSQGILEISIALESNRPWHQLETTLQQEEEEKMKKKHKNPATRAAEEAVERLEPPVLPEYLRGDNGPSGSEEEKEVKRLRSASTTPRQRETLTLMNMTALWEFPQRIPKKR